MLRMYRNVALAFAVAVVLSAAVVGLQTLWRGARGPGYATGDATDIRFVGMYVSGSFDLLDASGRKIGVLQSKVETPEESHEGRLPRCFVFDIPKLPGNTIMAPMPRVSPAGRRQNLVIGNSEEIVPTPAGDRLYARTDIADQYDSWFLSDRWPFKWKSHRETVAAVDVSMGYWSGPRGKAACTFTGTFTAGQKVARGAESLTILKYFDLESEYGSLCLFQSDSGVNFQTSFLVYDKAGRRHGTRNVAGLWTASGSGTITFAAEGLLPGDISAVTVDEEMHERVFHGLNILRPEPDKHAKDAYAGRLSARLGIDTPKSQQELSAALFKDVAATVEVCDLLRGMEIVQACWAISGAKPEAIGALTTAQRDKALRILDTWSATGDTLIRRESAYAGMKLDPRGFAARAVDCIAGDPRGLKVLADKLGAEGARAAEGILMEGSDTHWRLLNTMACLKANPSPEATDALARSARSGKPWLWCTALREERVVKALGPVEAWPDQLKTRWLIASEFASPQAAGAQAARDAREMLPELVTDELAMDPATFASVTRTMARECDRETSERVFLKFIRATREYAAAGEGIGVMVKHINLWHGVDMAGLGSDTAAPVVNAKGRNWREIAEEVIRWRDTGQTRPSRPSDYRVTPYDLRVVFADDKDHERSLVDIWSPPADSGLVGEVHIVKSGRWSAAYSIWPERTALGAPGPPSGWTGCGLRVYPEGNDTPSYHWRENVAISANPGFQPSLPLGQDAHVLVEHADSPKSVLSGTKVFSDWWAAHGPLPAPAIESTAAQAESAERR